MKDSIDIVAERFLKKNLSYFDDENKAEEYAKNMREDGSWKDLDYEGKTLPFWKCIEHFARLDYLAVSGKYDEQVMLGLKFWYQKERKDKNWWWNEIGIQLDLAICAVLLRNKFDEQLKKIVSETFNEYVEDRWTGTNRFWLAQNVIVRGIITKNAELIHRGKKYLADTIYISNIGEEGIQSDFAFAQHGFQLYNNGYGRALVIDACTWIDVFADTEFQFSQDRIDIITSLLLDGCGQMCFCDVPDFNSIGRDLVRGYNGRDTRISAYLPAIEILKKVSSRKDELDKLADFINGNSRAFERTKMFSTLNIMTGVHNGGYASVRFGSDKVLGGDVIEGKIINDEDRLSGYRGCFVSEYMVNGYEYDRIFPVWNWAFLPGVSCPDVEIRTERGAIMKSSFAGGVSDGKNGVCAIDLKEDFSDGDEKVIFGGKKACFFIGNEIIHLGCGLYSETSLNTTLNQCLFDKSFNIDGTAYGYEAIETPAKYILHGGIAYIFNEKTKVFVSAEHRDGEWGRITAVTEPIRVSKDVFTAYIPQAEKNGYEYAVLMNTDEQTAASYVFPDFINNEKVQAVKHDDLICAVFYEAGSIVIDNTNVTVTKPCFIILKSGEVIAKREIKA